MEPESPVCPYRTGQHRRWSGHRWSVFKAQTMLGQPNSFTTHGRTADVSLSKPAEKYRDETLRSLPDRLKSLVLQG